jgi:molybdenum-dependent DNA-binding transcriptional regulator ModE
MSKPKPAFKLWLETEEGFVFGPGVEALLRKVIEKGTLKEASD